MISVKNLSKKYGELTVLRDINAEIQKGEVISIIGPSGTGKSTFLRCINLLEQPSGGEIIIEGENILSKKVNIYQLRQKMGMVFRSFNLFSHLMIIENMMLGPEHLLKMSRKEAYGESMRLLEMVGLAEKARAYPDELSGGQKQRVAVARCLAMKPEIVLFDEPTSALDPTMVSEVLGVIRRLAGEGLTMMIVTHEMKFARDVSSRVFYMDEGIIYEDGTPAQIFDNPQKDKTRAFIRKIKSHEFEIRSKVFDFYEMNTELELFCRQQMLAPRQINNILLVIEELVVNKLLPSQPQDAVEITGFLGCSEESGTVELTIHYAGARQNPIEAMEQDDLSMMIVQKLAANMEYTYQEGMNRLRLQMNLANR